MSTRATSVTDQRDALGLDRLVRGGDPEQLARVHTASDDVADDEVVLGHLKRDLVPAGRREAEDLRGLLHPLAVEAHAGDRRVVRDEVFRDVLVEDAPVARVVVVDRLDVASNQALVLLHRHVRESRPPDLVQCGCGVAPSAWSCAWNRVLSIFPW